MIKEKVSASNWNEMWKIIMEKLEHNCINCKHGEDGDMSNPSRFIFCTKSLAMADLMMGQCCNQWE